MALYNSFDYYEAGKKFPEFSKEEIDIFADAFKEFDSDGSGSIDVKELTAAFEKMGQGANEEKIKELVEEFDSDHSGQIEWPEYLSMMRTFYPWKRLSYEINYLVPSRRFPEFTSEEIKVFIDSFKEFDKDGSGAIDATELGEAFAQMGQGVSPDDVQEILEEFDDDQSGEIEFGEFLEIMRTFYPFKRIIFEVEYYGPALKYPEFSREEIDVFVWAFRDFDADDSGSIDTKELGNIFKSMGQGVSSEELQEIIDEFDEDDSGEIEWPEFLAIMSQFYPFKRFEYELEFYGPAKKFPEFSKKEIDIFSLTFREFDVDGSGSIDAKELGVALKKMGQGASPEKLKSIIDEVDDNGNGEIEWSEYLQIMRNFYPFKLQDYEKKYFEPAKKYPEFSREDVEVFIDAFREFDADDSGSIDAKELDVAFKRMGQGCTPEKLQQIIEEVDDNGNGVVEWSEFLGIMRRLYAAKFDDKHPNQQSKPTSTPTKSTSPSVKNTNSTPTKTTTTTTTPVKNTTTTPAKNTTTTTTPVKNTTTTTSTPTKTTTTTSTTSSTTTTSQPPAKSFSSATKPTSSSTSTNSPLSSHRSATACASCGKTVYPIEEVRAMEQTYHKGCFKCQEEGCGVLLNLKTFKGAQGKVFCQKHVPTSKPTATPVSGNLATLNATSAPKLQKASGVKKNERMTFAPGELKVSGSNEEEK